ncbi:MAG: hypothetical protein JO014_10730 [Metakosakonia sp.]|nr:fimbrial protein [Phytobacter sp.]MBV8873185.1 hypothetical protein [Phytobacter sp.]
MRNYLFLVLSMVVSQPLYATAWGTDCSYETKIVNVQIPSGKKITIDPNAPVGTVFFEHYVPAQEGQLFKCKSNTSNTFTLQSRYLYAAGGQTVTMSGGGLSGTYPVYKTNVPGIGLVVRNGTNAFPFLGNSYTHTDAPGFSIISTTNFDIDIIKYGDIPVGARSLVIDSSVISAIEHVPKFSNSADTTRLPNGDVLLTRFILSPSTFNILTATCDTPDVSVNLGKRRVGDTSNREGGKFVTPWVDASIRLINCPVFYGTGERVENGENKDIVRNNIMTVTLMPVNATTSSQGIMPVDTGGSAASGVGIQLAWGTAASPQLVDFSAGKGFQNYTMSPSQGTTYTIPLVARYMQTASTINNIKAGNANGKITYLIDYY